MIFVIHIFKFQTSIINSHNKRGKRKLKYHLFFNDFIQNGLCSSFRIILILRNDERQISVIPGTTYVLKQSLRGFIIIENGPKVQFDTDVMLPEVRYKNIRKVAFSVDLA